MQGSPGASANTTPHGRNVQFFGNVRYMNAAGLKRKCDIEEYVEKVKKFC
jgi:hypothetical protein